MTKYGIDVSKHQGNIDWTKVRNSGKVEFAILRAGIGSSKDIKFEEYYQGAKSVGIPVGCYWYSKALTEAEARQEAETFLKTIAEKQFAYPVYLDMEESKQFALGKAKCSAVAEAFMSTVEKAGYFVGLYMSKSYLETYITEAVRNRYAVWVAHYGVSKTTYSGQFGMWQKSDTGVISGISDNKVDLDECYADYPAVIQSAGLNGFPKTEKISETVTSEKETIQITAVKDGKTYSGTLTEKS